jgi:hypothetical protein
MFGVSINSGEDQIFVHSFYQLMQLEQAQKKVAEEGGKQRAVS